MFRSVCVINPIEDSNFFKRRQSLTCRELPEPTCLSSKKSMKRDYLAFHDLNDGQSVCGFRIGFGRCKLEYFDYFCASKLSEPSTHFFETRTSCLSLAKFPQKRVL